MPLNHTRCDVFMCIATKSTYMGIYINYSSFNRDSKRQSQIRIVAMHLGYTKHEIPAYRIYIGIKDQGYFLICDPCIPDIPVYRIREYFFIWDPCILDILV